MDFIKTFQKLYLQDTPQISHWTRASENCTYGDIIVVSRDCYLCFWSANLEKCFYCFDCRKSQYSTDLMFCEKCELCYESIDCVNCYNCVFCQDCQNSTDCQYCYNCIGCNDCFGCAGLKRAKHHIFNKKYSAAEYQKKLAEIKTWSPAKIQREFQKVQLQTPRVYMHQMDNEQSFGDYLYHSKNCYWCFDSYLCEDSYYIYNNNLERGSKDCVDCGPIANTLEQCYDCAYMGYLFDCQHIYWCDYLNHCRWCINCWDCNHCFGSIYQKNREYRILNKQYKPPEYEKKTAEITNYLKNRGIKDLYGLIHA